MTGITELHTNPIHGEKQVSIHLTRDGFGSVTFTTTPGRAAMGVWTHPGHYECELSAAEVDDLIAGLTALRVQLRREERNHS